MSAAGQFVYLDTSVALAHLLSETKAPTDDLWHEPLVSSRLLEYEIHTRLHALDLAESHHEFAAALVSRVSLLELARPVLRLPRSRWPTGLRTLDALHLASMLFLREQGAEPRLASYDRRLSAAAQELGFAHYAP
ncbi:MAG: PIN domain-containing protein [Longimicrobiales bacterium]